MTGSSQEPRPDAARRRPGRPTSEELSTTGELIRRGGLAGALTTFVYLVIGIGFWSLVGFGLDRVFGTHVIVWIGGGIGACAGLYLVYIHMRSEHASGEHPSPPHRS